ncbi:MAG: helix-turn-helix transcriptional regulator [Nocardioides sp.]
MAARDADTIERLARTAGDSRELRARVVEHVRRTVPFDWFVFVLTDPATTVGVDPLAEAPPGVALPQLISAKYRTALNRWTALTASAALRERAAESPAWLEVQRFHGVVDVLSAVFRDHYGCWGFLDLWSRRSFQTQDLRQVDAVVPAVTSVLRRDQARSLRRPSAAEATGPVVLVLDDELRVVSRTAAADDWLARLLPPADGVLPVPAVAYNVAAQLVARERGVDPHLPRGRVHLGDGFWVSVGAARLGVGQGVAVAMEPITADDRMDLVGRAFALSPREGTVVAEVCAGRTTAEVAASLHLSPLTVQDHLKSVFRKTGVRSRRELAALALGAAPIAETRSWR